jgi:hypothetical protein
MVIVTCVGGFPLRELIWYRYNTMADDLTGLFCTRPYERMGLAKELGDAEKAV